MTHEEVLLVSDPVPGVRMLTMNRPSKLNAMNEALVRALHDGLEEVSSDSQCRVVILTGAGRGFCAGLDLGGYGAPRTDRGRVQGLFAIQEQIAGLIPRLRGLPQPVIAAVNGAATGGGLSLVLGADVRLASTSARFSAAFVRVGLSGCDIGTSWTLPRLVGAGRAHEMMLTGRVIDAVEAVRVGLVLEAVSPEHLMASVLETARHILENSPMGVRMTKQVMWSALEIPAQSAAMDLENRTQVLLAQTDDHKEAVRSFVERRPPAYKDS